jgi:hypothetical protein
LIIDHCVFVCITTHTWSPVARRTHTQNCRRLRTLWNRQVSLSQLPTLFLHPVAGLVDFKIARRLGVQGPIDTYIHTRSVFTARFSIQQALRRQSGPEPVPSGDTRFSATAAHRPRLFLVSHFLPLVPRASYRCLGRRQKPSLTPQPQSASQLHPVKALTWADLL